MQNTISKNTNRKNLLQLLVLRLIAILGQIATILIVNYALHINLPLVPMFLVLLILTFINCISFYRYKSAKNISDRSLFVELLFDVAALTIQLYFSGGISNPFISLFLLQVIIAAILLRAIYAWLIAALTILCYIALSFYYQEMHAFHHHDSGDFFNLHLQGMLISYVFATILMLIFVTRIIRNLKEGDQRINLLTQQAIEKEQVMRMGLMATGAAHELSTPLSTISVIISDWKKMNLQKDLIADIEVIESQVARCKKILSDILLSSGKSRVEEAQRVAIKEVFDDLIQEWSSSRKPANLIYNFYNEGNTQPKKQIILDNILSNILSQAFFNIFDNALEESPDFVLIDVKVQKDDIVINIEDRGQGFDSKVIEEIGKPNLTTKNSSALKNNSGLGLFLAINAFDRIGGKLQISNLVQGAKVIVKIPLKNL